MTAADKIKKAKVKLLLAQPFFATLALRMQYIEDPTVPTACTNGKCIRYNPAFIDTLSLEETEFIIAHECMHPALLHHTRRMGRDPLKFNIAADYPVNEILTKSGLKMPKGGLLDAQYYDKTTDEIYRLLPDPPKCGGEGGSGDPGGCGMVEDGQFNSQSQSTQMEADMKQVLAQAAEAAKRAGKLPAHLERLVGAVLEPRVNWREALAHFIVASDKSDYSFKKPNTRYLHSGFYLPSLESDNKLGDIILFVDTSGSIDAVTINQFAGEMQEIVNTFNSGFRVVYIDAEVAGEEYVEPDEMVELHPKGGGGTCFRPGFEMLAEEGREPLCVVYLTDGYCSSFPTVPAFPVLWCLIERNQHFHPPFGDTIYMDL